MFNLLYMNRLSKTGSAIFVSLMCSLLSEDLYSKIILSSMQLALCHVAAVKHPPYIIIVQIIYFLDFWIIWLSLSQFENRVLLKPVLVGMGSVALFQNCT